MGFSRILFRFAKEGEARYLSHRDLMRLFERALRRARLPVRMTQGFNPHPKLTIPAALPLGVEACDEALAVEFEPPVEPGQAMQRLGGQLPAGVRLLAAETLPQRARLRVGSVVYEARLPEGRRVSPADVERFLARPAIVVRRKSGAEFDIRPALLAMGVGPGGLWFEVAVSDSGTPRAAEVLAALLGVEAEGLAPVRLRRTRVNLLLARPRAAAVGPPHRGA